MRHKYVSCEKHQSRNIKTYAKNPLTLLLCVARKENGGVCVSPLQVNNLFLKIIEINYIVIALSENVEIHEADRSFVLCNKI